MLRNANSFGYGTSGITDATIAIDEVCNLNETNLMYTMGNSDIPSGTRDSHQKQQMTKKLTHSSVEKKLLKNLSSDEKMTKCINSSSPPGEWKTQNPVAREHTRRNSSVV